jgi:hypothetical protein
VLAFWGGVLMAARQYPSEYDWRYMPVSYLFSDSLNPAGHLWATVGIVLCSVGLLSWALMAQRWTHADASIHPSGPRAIQVGSFCMACSAALPASVLLHKGHELLAIVAFAGLCLGIFLMMFQLIERILLRRKCGFIGNSRRFASVLAGTTVLSILLAGLAQAYVYYALPALPWVNLTWRDRGVPVYLSFAFWEWVTCFVLSSYMTILALTAYRHLPSGLAAQNWRLENGRNSGSS